MDVAAQATLVATHHQEHLRVRFIADDAISNVRPCIMEPVGERNVRLFIKTGAQLDDDGDLVREADSSRDG